MAEFVELPSFINHELLEASMKEYERRYNDGSWDAWTEVGMRAARKRDDRLLKALEKGAELLDQLTELQYGQFRRSSRWDHDEIGNRCEPMDTQAWKQAYEWCDKGEPLGYLAPVYGMAAWMLGYHGI